ncbi:sugar phosphate isomerase/epimerase [bacterium SCSIO 12643]|nr:sugar phosphate isomerase/epimerase [bacterium SCSIO 12643]
MIYVSSSCVKARKIKDAVETIAKFGFKRIELSGGTDYYEGYLDDLVELKNKYGLEYLLHNYYPAPKEHFVCNLASLNEDVYQATLNHYKNSIEVSEKLGAKQFGLHAGFLIDPKVTELGKPITKQNAFNKSEAIDRFCEGLSIVQNYSPNVEVFVENNVFSAKNMENFKFNPFLFTSYEGLLELTQHLDFSVLLDIAHLKVSCNTLNIDFDTQLEKVFAIANYIHISDNDGKSDSNQMVQKKSDLFKKLKHFDLTNKPITLEIYETLENIQNSYQLIFPLTHSKNATK